MFKFSIKTSAILFSILFLISGCSKDEKDKKETTNLCGNEKVQLMSDDPDCGIVDITDYCLSEINKYRAMKNLAPYTKAINDRQICAGLEAKHALENNKTHWSDGCGWKSQGGAGGGRNPNGTVKASVTWVPKLFYQEGPSGGHYQGMMRPETRAISCGYYALNRNKHVILVNYY